MTIEEKIDTIQKQLVHIAQVLEDIRFNLTPQGGLRSELNTSFTQIEEKIDKL